MNFQALKGMVDTLIQAFKCPDCSSTVTDEFIEIVGAAGANINIDIECPKCQKHSMVKAEIFPMSVPIEMIISEKDLENIEDKEMEIMQEKLSTIENFNVKFKEISTNIESGKNIKNNNLIKDSEIISLNKNLKRGNFSMEKLFSV